MRPRIDGELGVLQRADAAVALGDALHAEERRGVRHRHPDESAAGMAPRRRGPADPSLVTVRFGLPHDLLRGEVDAAGREGVADEEVVGLVGVVVRRPP